MDQNLLISLTVAGFIGAAAGYLGSIMVLRRMALVGDALSHVALPGMGIALAFNWNPFLWAFMFLGAAVWIIWLLEGRTRIPTEALVGILFTVSLAIGILITPELELIEALFGDISGVSVFDGVMAVVLSVAVFVIGRRIYKGLILGTISEDLAVSSGVKLRKINLVFLILVSVVVALGVKVVGTLLMGALVIIAATAAKNLSRNLAGFSSLSTVFGLVSAPSGVYLAHIFELPPGPIVVLASSIIFLLSLLNKK